MPRSLTTKDVDLAAQRAADLAGAERASAELGDLVVLAQEVTAVASRSGGWWAVEVPEVPGAFTQARRLDQVAAMAADAVATLTGEDARNVTVNVTAALSEDEQARIEAVRRATESAARAAAAAAAETRVLVKDLRARGLSVRDVGVLLGVSPQRVSQLIAR